MDRRSILIDIQAVGGIELIEKSGNATVGFYESAVDPVYAFIDIKGEYEGIPGDAIVAALTDGIERKHPGEAGYLLWFASRVSTFRDESCDPWFLYFTRRMCASAADLKERGYDPAFALECVIENGEFLQSTRGDGFYADMQKIRIAEDMDLFCFQMPGGGSIFIIETPDEYVMIDTGYGIYYEDTVSMLARFGISDLSRLRRIVITHADTDHCGAAGYFDATFYTSRATIPILVINNRAVGSKSSNCALEIDYTLMINSFAGMTLPDPENTIILDEDTGLKYDIFPVIGSMDINGYRFEVVLSCGGHQAGLFYLICRELGVIFSSDTILNFDSLNDSRQRYNFIAHYLITSVNVDKKRTRLERDALFRVAEEIDGEMKEKGGRCLICCGHGALSHLKGYCSLESIGGIMHYTHDQT